MVVMSLLFAALTSYAGSTRYPRIEPDKFGCTVLEGNLTEGSGEALGLVIEQLCDMSRDFSFDAKRNLLCCVGR